MDRSATSARSYTLGLSVFITRPTGRIVTALAATAAWLKAGNYTARLPDDCVTA